MCRSVYRTALTERFEQHDAPEKSSRVALIGYRVGLDTRTTSADNLPLTATRRVHNVEGWRCHERGLELDFAVLVGRCPGAATGGRCQRYVPNRRLVAARLAVRGRLVCRLALHRISAARGDRACAVAGIAALHRPRRHLVGRAESG